MVAIIWWNIVGVACRVMCDISRTMSWKEAVKESSLYTDASKRCFPEVFKLCWLRRVVKRPVEDRKSGTRCWLVMASQNGRGNFLLPAETEIPAPAITTIFLFVRKTLRRRWSCRSSCSRFSGSELSSSVCKSKYSVVRSLG